MYYQQQNLIKINFFFYYYIIYHENKICEKTETIKKLKTHIDLALKIEIFVLFEHLQ